MIMADTRSSDGSKLNQFPCFQMATNVSEHNITAWIYELMTGEEYSTCPLKSSSMTKKLSPRTLEKKEGSGDKTETGVTSTNDQEEETKKQRDGARKATTCMYHTVCIYLLYCICTVCIYLFCVFHNVTLTNKRMNISTIIAL